MGRPIHKAYGSALRILIAWLLALQPMTAAYAAAATAEAPLAMELCRGLPLSNEGAPDKSIPAGTDHSPECCISCAPAPAAPPAAGAEIAASASFAEILADRTEPLFVATAGLGPQSARAPPL